MTLSPPLRSFTSIIGIPFLALLLASCGGTRDGDAALGKHRASHAYSKGSIPAEFRGQAPALSDAQVLGFLPDTTVAAWFVRSPKALDAATEFSVIIGEYKEVYAEILPHITTPSGANFLVPATWSRIGIDPERPAGVAALLGEDVVGVFFATLSDKDLFRKSLDDVGTQAKIGPVVAASAGESTIYVYQDFDEVAFVVRGDVVMLVIPDRDRDLEASVLAVAGSNSQPTLASSGRVAKAFAGFDYGKDMAGFLAFDTLADSFLQSRGDGRQENFAGEENERRVLIAEAKAENRSKEEIARLEKGLLEAMRWQREARLRFEATTRLIQGLFGDTGTVAVGVQLDSNTTRLRAQLSPVAKSIPSRLLQSSDRVFALPGKLQENPLFLLAAHVDPSAAIELFHLLIQSEGTTHKEVDRDIHKELGISLDEVIALFDGEVSGALTTEQSAYAQDSAYVSPEQSMGIHLLAHLADPQAARLLFDKLCSHRKFARFVVPSGGSKALVVPSFNERKLRIEIAGDYLQAVSVSEMPSPPEWSESETLLLDVPSSPAIMVLDAALVSGIKDGPHYLFTAQRNEDKAATARAKPVRDELAQLYKKRATLLGAERGDEGAGRLVASAHTYGNGYAVLARVIGKRKNLGRSLQSLVESVSYDVAQARRGKIDALATVKARIEELENSLWSVIEGEGPH